MPPPTPTSSQEDCTLFSVKQYECILTGGQVTCWPLDRIFRQCNKGPAIEVTNALVPSDSGDGGMMVDSDFIASPPKGKNWADLR